jgi:hypothetical protein
MLTSTEFQTNVERSCYLWLCRAKTSFRSHAAWILCHDYIIHVLIFSLVDFFFVQFFSSLCASCVSFTLFFVSYLLVYTFLTFAF